MKKYYFLLVICLDAQEVLQICALETIKWQPRAFCSVPSTIAIFPRY